MLPETHGGVHRCQKRWERGDNRRKCLERGPRDVAAARSHRRREYLHFDFERFDFGLRPVVDQYGGQETGERERDEYAEGVRQHRVAPRQ